MAGEWVVTTLDDAPVEIIDGDRGKNYPSQAEFYPNGHCLFLNAGNVTATGFNFSNCAFITNEKDALLRKGKLAREDVVLTTRGTVGNVAYYNDAIPFDHIRINSGMVILRALSGELSPLFLYHFVRSRIFRSQVEALRTGSAQPQLPIRDINRIEIPIPPLPEQSAIAHILGSLDDKIDLNRRMNETLEGIARAVFKSWFVDFDPVRAKSEGRDPGLPKHIADLFPDEFEDSELGPIPKGWACMSLDDIADYLNGLACQKYPPIDGEPFLPVIKIKELRQGITENTDTANINVSEDYLVHDGDVLFSWSGSLMVKIWTGGDGILNQHLFKVNSRDFPKWFYFHWTKHHLEEFSRIAADKATTMGHIKRHHLQDALVIKPDEKLLQSADEIISPIISKIIYVDLEIRTISKLRDTLLPKLLSGELRVQDAEKLAGAVL